MAVGVVDSGGGDGVPGEEFCQRRLVLCLALTVLDRLPAGFVKCKVQHGRKAFRDGNGEDTPSCLPRAQVVRPDEVG